MTDFIVKAVHLDGFSWPVWSMLRSLDGKELGDAEWWRRMAVLQNAAARTGDGNLLAVLDNARKNRFNVGFEAPEVVSTNNLPPLSAEECVKRWFQQLDEDNKLNILKVAMTKMLEATDDEGKKLFAKKQHWMAVYMVIRDRLGMNIPQKKFSTYAEKITPVECPARLRISATTMTNFSKTVPDGMYFKLKTNQNPFYPQCSFLWTCIKGLYYSKISTDE